MMARQEILKDIEANEAIRQNNVDENAKKHFLFVLCNAYYIVPQ